MVREVGFYEPENAPEPIYLYAGKAFISFTAIRTHLIASKGFSIQTTDAILESLPKLSKEDAMDSFKQSDLNAELYDQYFGEKKSFLKKILSFFK